VSIEPTPGPPTAVSTVAAFVFLGPLIGGLSLAVPLAIYGIATSLGSDWAWEAAVALPVVSIPLSFLLGVLPALSVGLAASILRGRLGARGYLTSCTVLGVAAAAGFNLILEAGLSGPGPRLGAVPWIFVIPGGVAGLACAWLTRPRDRKAA